MSVKGITWLWIRLGLYDDLEKILCTTNWYTKFFLVYWLIACFTIFSDGIKWHQNSHEFYRFSYLGRLGWYSFRSFIRWIRTLSGLSGYELTHYHDQAVDWNNTEGHRPCHSQIRWCGQAPAVNHKPKVSFERHSDIFLLREKENDGELYLWSYSFDFALEEALKCLSEFKISRALTIGTQRSNFYTDFWK